MGPLLDLINSVVRLLNDRHWMCAMKEPEWGFGGWRFRVLLWLLPWAFVWVGLIVKIIWILLRLLQQLGSDFLPHLNESAPSLTGSLSEQMVSSCNVCRDLPCPLLCPRVKWFLHGVGRQPISADVHTPCWSLSSENWEGEPDCDPRCDNTCN